MIISLSLNDRNLIREAAIMVYRHHQFLQQINFIYPVYSPESISHRS